MDIVVYGVLCPPERERQAAYRMLEVAVGREYGLEKMPEIQRADGGKPFFPDVPHICFNLSHSRGAAVCALHDRPLGIDVEKLRPAPRRLARGMEDEAFFRWWTAREATIKRQGLGLAALLKEWEPDARCRVVEDLLPGWIVTVCPTAESPIRMVRIGWDELGLEQE